MQGSLQRELRGIFQPEIPEEARDKFLKKELDAKRERQMSQNKREHVTLISDSRIHIFKDFTKTKVLQDLLIPPIQTGEKPTATKKQASSRRYKKTGPAQTTKTLGSTDGGTTTLPA